MLASIREKGNKLYSNKSRVRVWTLLQVRRAYRWVIMSRAVRGLQFNIGPNSLSCISDTCMRMQIIRGS